MTLDSKKITRIYLADDDDDDCVFFREALHELEPTLQVSVSSNGEQLMQILREQRAAPSDLIFLDLNMPLKNGYECLADINEDKELSRIPIVILSTSAHRHAKGMLGDYKIRYYIKKPSSYAQLKQVLHDILTNLPTEADTGNTEFGN